MTDERRTPPPTAEGWFVLHDFRTVDWDAWRDAPDREREAAIEAGRAYLEDAEAVADADDGDSAVYSVVGHEADFLVVHMRPSLGDVELLERQFDATELGRFTDQSNSYVSVTEAGGYSERAREYIEGDLDDDSGLANYMETRIYPEVPDADHVCFYPMDKRRDPEYNWYDLPFEERAEHMAAHGEVGREYAGKVTQMISGSIGLDDWEWGVTLWGDDPTDFKDLLYEMRFDPSSSKYAEFGPFFVGHRFDPADLDALLAAEPIHHDGEESAADASGGPPAGVTGDDSGGPPAGVADDGNGGPPPGVTGDDSGGPPPGVTGDDGSDAVTGEGAEEVRDELADSGVYAGQPRGEDVYALVLYSSADADELFEAVSGLRSNFDHYDTHVETSVYRPEDGEGDAAVASIWETQSAADTAAGFLGDLPGAVRRPGEGDDGWGTMGMFYQVNADHREDFVETFGEVSDVLADMDGHRETRLLVDHEDETAMFIDSRWDAREDALAFFRSEDFAETVEWGREVLADRPRHVFLA